MFDKFYTKVSNIINSHLPLKPLTRKESKFQTKPWITQGLKVSIANKNRLYRHYLKTRTCYSHTKFKCYRNNLFIYLFFLFVSFYLLITCKLVDVIYSCFTANLPPLFEHYLVLLSSISFLVILRKHYLFCINIL